MSLSSRSRLPKEHGAWAMLYVPFALGVLVAGRISIGVLLLFLATTTLFVSRESLLIWWRARNRGKQNDHAGRLLITYVAIVAVTGAPLVLVYRLYWLLPLSVLGAALLGLNGIHATKFRDRTAASEIMAILGLTMTAPAAYYVGSNQWGPMALGLWALSAAYFASSVFYIKLRVAGLHARRPVDKQRARFQCIAYHSSLLASLVTLALTQSLPLSGLIAFAPVLTRTTWSLVRPARQLNLRRIGTAEIFYSLIFLLFTTITFRSTP